MHFLCLEPRETHKIVLKFTKNLVLKFHFLLLGALTQFDVSLHQYADDTQLYIASSKSDMNRQVTELPVYCSSAVQSEWSRY